MFSYFFPAPITRFEKSEYLSPLIAYIEAIRNKNNKLYKIIDAYVKKVEATQQLTTSEIDELKKTMKKYEALTQLLKDIDEARKQFDQTIEPLQEDKVEALQTVKTLLRIYADFLQKKHEDLAVNRNNSRQNVDKTFQMSTYVGATLFACFAPLSFPVGVLLIAGTTGASAGVGYMTGLSDYTPETIKLLKQFEGKLKSTEKKLENLLAQQELCITYQASHMTPL